MQQPPHFFSYVRRTRPFTIVEGTPKPIKVSYLKSLPGFVSPMGLLSPRMWISATHRNAPARGSHGSYPGRQACQRPLNIAPKHTFLSYETLPRRFPRKYQPGFRQKVKMASSWSPQSTTIPIRLLALPEGTAAAIAAYSAPQYLVSPHQECSQQPTPSTFDFLISQRVEFPRGNGRKGLDCENGF